MHKINARTTLLMHALLIAGFIAAPAVASAASKIVCWKDASGKVIGCGDKVPPEFQSSATKELDPRGVTRKTTESADETAQRRAREQEAAQQKANDERRTIDQKRQDTALLETYSSEKEIDIKRDRELQMVDLQIEQLNTALKGADARYSEAKARLDGAEKNNKTPSASLKEDVARAAADKQRLADRIEGKRNEKDELRKRYADYKKRYAELRSGAAIPGQMPVAAKK